MKCIKTFGVNPQPVQKNISRFPKGALNKDERSKMDSKEKNNLLLVRNYQSKIAKKIDRRKFINESDSIMKPTGSSSKVARSEEDHKVMQSAVEDEQGAVNADSEELLAVAPEGRENTINGEKKNNITLNENILENSEDIVSKKEEKKFQENINTDLENLQILNSGEHRKLQTDAQTIPNTKDFSENLLTQTQENNLIDPKKDILKKNTSEIPEPIEADSAFEEELANEFIEEDEENYTQQNTHQPKPLQDLQDKSEIEGDNNESSKEILIKNSVEIKHKKSKTNIKPLDSFQKQINFLKYNL